MKKGQILNTFPQGDWFLEQDKPYHCNLFQVNKVLIEKKTKYQDIAIMDLLEMGKTLFLDGSIQSSQFDEKLYHELLVHIPLLAHKKPQTVLILGGGEMATIREILLHKSIQKIVMVDIDGELVEFCKQYLFEWHQNTYKDKRVTLVYNDARKYLEHSKEKFDIIIGDLVEPFEKSPALLLYTKEFYTIVKNHLTQGGIFSSQGEPLPSSLQDTELRHLQICATLEKVFPIVRPYHQFLPSFFADWGFVFASETVDPLMLSTKIIKNKLMKTLIRQPSYVSSETYQNLFTIPYYIDKIKKKKIITPFTDKKALI